MRRARLGPPEFVRDGPADREPRRRRSTARPQRDRGHDPRHGDPGDTALMAGGLEAFATRALETPRGTVHAVTKGEGPPLLLVHGFPETHLMWHAVAPALAERFTVVAADLPGYGDSFRPPGRERSRGALQARAGGGSRRRDGRARPRARSPSPATTAARAGRLPDGARPSRARHAARRARRRPDGRDLARAPTPRFALGYWHWAFLAQPAPLPERLILGDPDGFWLAAERMGLKPGDPRYPDEVVAAYRAQLDDPAFVDRDVRGLPGGRDDRPRARRRRGRRTIACPVRALWGGDGRAPALLRGPARAVADASRPTSPAAPIEGASHFLVEDEPAEIIRELTEFFT